MSLGKMWRFPTITESFVDADAAANNCIAAVNWERWNQCQQTGSDYNPLNPPMVSTAPFLELTHGSIFIAGNQYG